jgi:hypothetical protein
MAMRHNRLIIFTGALGALIVMTVLSAAMGFTLPNLIPRAYTHYAVRSSQLDRQFYFIPRIHLMVSFLFFLSSSGRRAPCLPFSDSGC